MDIKLSQRVQQIEPSITLAISAQAKALQAAGKDIINLSVGEPDFDTPSFIKQAAIEALNAGFTKYTASDGIVELKQAICDKFRKENNLKYHLSQTIASCGAKQSLFNLLQATINPQDEVIMPAPYWVSYPSMVLLAGGKPITIETDIEQNYNISPEQLDEAITPKTRLIILNSPSNPSGKVYSADELTELASVLDQYPHIRIASDDIYEHILWNDDGFSNIINACPELYERCFIINGVSKAYAMTGWRIGYTAGPEKVIAAMKKVQSQSTSNPNSIAQYAACAALQGDQSFLQDTVASFKNRHDMVYAALCNMKNVHVSAADGTFYIFPSVQNIIDNHPKLTNDIDFVKALLEEQGVAVVPGTPFGMPGSIRLSFATSEKNLTAGLQRLAEFIKV